MMSLVRLNSWEGAASLLINIFLTNDRLNGQPANNGNVILSIVTPSTHPGVYIEPATGNVIVGYGTPAGVYRIVYRICEKQLPQNCDQAVVTVTVVDDCELVIPNGFSPNGDGIADFWRIKCLDKYPDARVEIYNRWGNLVYDLDHYGNTDVHGATDAWWDGHSTHKWTLGSEKLPAGTYFYILDLRDGSKPLNGFIFLNR
jgi:gliding motility-associated-like protein